VKMLPFDNKSEFQIVINMRRHAARGDGAGGRDLARAAIAEPEVVNVQAYVGAASPYNFNGSCGTTSFAAHRIRRPAGEPGGQGRARGPEPRGPRRVREKLAPIAARLNARLQVAEVPPGPPVLQTLVAEVYGPTRPAASSWRAACATSSSRRPASWTWIGTWRRRSQAHVARG